MKGLRKAPLEPRQAAELLLFPAVRSQGAQLKVVGQWRALLHARIQMTNETVQLCHIEGTPSADSTSVLCYWVGQVSWGCLSDLTRAMQALGVLGMLN